MYERMVCRDHKTKKILCLFQPKDFNIIIGKVYNDGLGCVIFATYSLKLNPL